MLKANIVQRNGKSYVSVSNVTTNCNISNLEIDMKYHNTTPLLSNVINRMANANWRRFKGIIYGSMEKYVVDFIIRSIVAPILGEIACQDFYHMK